jgi:hypothetical protein
MASESDMAGHEIDVEQTDSDLEQELQSDDVQSEALQGDSATFGDGYESGLKQISDEISRQLKELDKRWIAKWAPQDLAIKNHERRIKALESRRPR